MDSERAVEEVIALARERLRADVLAGRKEDTMDCVCGESIRETAVGSGDWRWVHDANGSPLCPDGRGSVQPDPDRS